MRTQQELDLLCEQAVELRREGRSRREIKEILGPMSNATLNDALKGEPPPAERTSPRYAESKRQAADGVRRHWAAERSAREEARRAAIGAAAAQIQGLTEREIIVAGAIAYWCEGAKSKPYRISEHVKFVNSDPGLIRFFLAFLDRVGVSPDRLRYCVLIHESADAEAAASYWARVVGVAPERFARPGIKRHIPRTTPGSNPDYHGCLQVSVADSSELYRAVSGWAQGVMTAGREG